MFNNPKELGINTINFFYIPDLNTNEVIDYKIKDLLNFKNSLSIPIKKRLNFKKPFLYYLLYFFRYSSTHLTASLTF